MTILRERPSPSDEKERQDRECRAAAEAFIRILYPELAVGLPDDDDGRPAQEDECWRQPG
jgi:hypothetical protein